MPKNKIYWTKEKCEEEAKKYHTINDFSNLSSSAYSIAVQRGWLKDITKHISRKKKDSNYWTKERCLEEAKKYEYKIDFELFSKSAYNECSENGWLEEACSHMKRKKGFKTKHWTYELCLEEAQHYLSKKEFRQKSNKAYNAAYKHKWLKDIIKIYKKTNNE